MVEQKSFREDLYFRLNTYNVFIPPLRERTEDIISLSEHYIKQFNIKFSKNFKGISEDAKNLLLKCTWKGNVRELRNVIERIILFENDSVIKNEHLQFLITLKGTPQSETAVETNRGLSLLPEEGIDSELDRIEKKLIQTALQITNNNKAEAAKLLKISPPNLQYRLKKYNIS
jgi:transcriptional regulator with PAS, ATPase and Fis domain